MEHSRQHILTALRLIFRPIAKILLHAGITWQEIAEVIKTTLVDVAGAEFGIRGRPTNASRVAILTGFTRKEVGRLRNLLGDKDVQTDERMNHATRVLTGWYTDDAFLGADGAPRALDGEGSDESFAALCRRYASDVPATTMLKELKHVGAVVDGPEGKLIAQTRYYMPRQMDPERVLSSGSVMEDLGSTVAYNLYRDANDPPKFERRAHNTRVPESAKPRFQAYLETEGQAFLEKVDRWLTDNEIEEHSAEKGIRLGLGAYWIEQETD
jgi:hypothetical protein